MGFFKYSISASQSSPKQYNQLFKSINYQYCHLINWNLFTCVWHLFCSGTPRKRNMKMWFRSFVKCLIKNNRLNSAQTLRSPSSGILISIISAITQHLSIRRVTLPRKKSKRFDCDSSLLLSGAALLYAPVLLEGLKRRRMPIHNERLHSSALPKR